MDTPHRNLKNAFRLCRRELVSTSKKITIEIEDEYTKTQNKLDRELVDKLSTLLTHTQLLHEIQVWT